MASAPDAELLLRQPSIETLDSLTPQGRRTPAHWAGRLTAVAFVAIHVAPLALWWTGVTLADIVVCVALYAARMFFITAGYHRYFAHRTYKLGRVMQFIMAWGGSLAAQKGVLWWASTHRHHHKHSDLDQDAHSPRHGVFWSHVGWILSPAADATDYDRIRDFAKYPELVWLDKYYLIPPTLLGIATFLIGGWSMLVGGFFLSTVLLWHGTFSINSLAHLWGSRRYPTTDDSRNNLWLALLTLGEGWHNNHHHYQSSANQGFFWWEVDISFYLLRALSWVGLASDLRLPPERVLRRDGSLRDAR